MYVWIDPPGDDPGTVHEVQGDDVETVSAVAALYPIPADNADRLRRWNFACEGDPHVTVERAQQWRDELGAWGVTVLRELPDDLQAKVIRL